MSWLDVIGRIGTQSNNLGQCVRAQVKLRDEVVGELELTLGQWDDLRTVKARYEPDSLRWLNVAALDDVEKATR